MRENAVSVTMPGLTDKTCEVLDLLIDHKTSKAIALMLEISPHTVDQRIQFAKRCLGAKSRSDLARLYRDIKLTYGQMTYEESHMSNAIKAVQHRRQDERVRPEDPNWLRNEPTSMEEVANRIVPELFDGANGKWYRFLAILAMTFLIILVTLGGLATYSTLAGMFPG